MKGSDLLSAISYVKKLNESKKVLEDNGIIFPLVGIDKLDSLETKLKNKVDENTIVLLEALVSI